MAEVVKKPDRNVRDYSDIAKRSTGDAGIFQYLFFLHLRLERMISILYSVIDRKPKQNWHTSYKRLKPSSACVRRRCRFKWWNAPNRFWCRSRRSCGRRRRWTPKSVDRPRPRNSSTQTMIKRLSSMNEFSL